MASDHEELLQRVEDGTSEFCCFESHDIVTESVVFDHTENPAVVARQIFVWNTSL